MKKRINTLAALLMGVIFIINPIQTSALPERNLIEQQETDEETMEISIEEISHNVSKSAAKKWTENEVTPEDTGITDTYIKKEYVEYIRKIRSEYFSDLKVSLIISIIEAESSGNPNLCNYLGCKGLMQVYEKYHKWRMKKYGVTNLYDPYSNILIGCDILWDYTQEWDGNLYAALMRYNGSKNLKEKVAKGEYSEYARKVMKRAKELSKYYD